MLLGEPGTRKSSAIKYMGKMIRAAGYDFFAADRSSREKFLLDLGGDDEEDGRGLAKKVREANGHNVTDLNLWGSSLSSKEIKEVLILADEFNEFVSAGNVDFYTTLGNLWDWDDENKPYQDKVKNSKSVSIFQPTVSLLGGNTQENFARAFPPEILGHGFLSRLLLIHGTPSGRKIAFPKSPPEEATKVITNRLREIQKGDGRRGDVLVGPPARNLLEKIYTSQIGISDPRFKGYNTRRYTHLLKLCIITAAAMDEQVITEEVVFYANTMLSAVEILMPTAIGEFGKSKNSDVSNQIVTILQDAQSPLTALQMWKKGLHKQLDKLQSLSEILNNLRAAEKIQFVQLPGGKGGGWLPKKEVVEKVEFVDYSLLSEEERNMI
jgi:hypothetical protein